jgi:hypothetical protein
MILMLMRMHMLMRMLMHVLLVIFVSMPMSMFMFVHMFVFSSSVASFMRVHVFRQHFFFFIRMLVLSVRLVFMHMFHLYFMRS